MNQQPPSLLAVRTRPQELSPSTVEEVVLLGTTLRWGVNVSQLEPLIHSACSLWQRAQVPPTGNEGALSLFWFPLGEYEATTGYLFPHAPARSVLHHPAEGMALIQDHVATVVLTASEVPQRSFLLGFALEAVLKRPPFYQIHAAAVEKEGRAVLLAAESGRGKSALSLFLTLCCGYRYLGDDAILIDGRTTVLIGAPDRIEIWPEVAELVLASGISIPERVISWKGSRRGGGRKMVLPAEALLGDRTAVMAPLAAVVFLEEGEDFAVRRVAPSRARGLLRPVPLFGRRSLVWGWRPIAERLVRSVPFLSLRIDHPSDPRENARRFDAVLQEVLFSA
ncbi:MAG: hypothetical protein KatS3mg115_1701 [Candidatus Poribacteria bacterium]|nr:MAG: hypothetical protein KatS3mg115_1701 [Candidatus Poribacteria bacterium]